MSFFNRPRLVVSVRENPRDREEYLRERAEIEKRESKLLEWLGIGVLAPKKQRTKS